MTRYCPITYDAVDSNTIYSKRGLKLLSPKLETLVPLPYSAQEQRNEAAARASKLSIQGFQPKISAILDLNLQTFVFVDTGGDYILKPENNLWPELPANEAISMSLAERFNIEVPVHGLVFTKNDELTYFIKRFDRMKAGFFGSREASSRDPDFRNKKIATEDFAQLSNENRDTKYESSIEKVIKIVRDFTTFPDIEYPTLFRRIIFNFIIGNEDMHLKNYSLIDRNGTWKLAPAYDFVNTTIAIKSASKEGVSQIEESALPINGRKNKIKREDFISYLTEKHLNLTKKITDGIMAELEALKPTFIDLIERSYLTVDMKEAYVDLLNERYCRLF